MFSNTLVTTDDLAAHLGDPDWLVFDCRFTLSDTAAGRLAYDKAHIPGAHYVHLDNDLCAPIGPATGRHPLPDPAVFTERLCRWGVGMDKQIVVYDDSFGSIACRLWWMLRWVGHPAVALLDGGYPKWAREKRPLDTAIPDTVDVACAGQAEPSRIATADDVLLASRTGNTLVFDARPDRRFTGEHDPVDRVPGHVPGALNVQFEDNLDLGGTFLPPAELREHYLALMQGRPAGQIIHMCGSGVTACHNVLAMEIAGLPGSRLYPGSWSEWITDPARPIATGE